MLVYYFLSPYLMSGAAVLLHGSFEVKRLKSLEQYKKC